MPLEKFVVGGGGLISLEHNPKFNNLACLTRAGELTLRRLNSSGWETVWTVTLEKLLMATLVGMCWRPDGTELVLVSSDGQLVFYDRENASSPRYAALFSKGLAPLANSEKITFSKWCSFGKVSTGQTPIEVTLPPLACVYPHVTSALELLLGKDKANSGFRKTLGDIQDHESPNEANLLILCSNLGGVFAFVDAAVFLSAASYPELASKKVANVSISADFSSLILHAASCTESSKGLEIYKIGLRLPVSLPRLQHVVEKAQAFRKLFSLLVLSTQDVYNDYLEYEKLQRQYLNLMRESMGAVTKNEANKDLIVTEMLQSFLTGRPEPAFQHFLLHKLKEQGLGDWITTVKDLLHDMHGVIVQFLNPGWQALILAFDDFIAPYANIWSDCSAISLQIMYMQQRLLAIERAVLLQMDLFHAFSSWLRQAFVDASGDAIEYYYYDGPLDEQVLTYIEYCLTDNVFFKWLFAGLTKDVPLPSKLSRGAWIQDECLHELATVGCELRDEVLSLQSVRDALNTVVDHVEAKLCKLKLEQVFSDSFAESLSASTNNAVTNRLVAFTNCDGSVLLASVDTLIGDVIHLERTSLDASLSDSKPCRISLPTQFGNASCSGKVENVSVQSLSFVDSSTLAVVSAVIEKENDQMHHTLSLLSLPESHGSLPMTANLCWQTKFSPNLLNMMTAPTKDVQSQPTTKFKVKPICAQSNALPQPVYTTFHKPTNRLFIVDGGRKRVLSQSLP